MRMRSSQLAAVAAILLLMLTACATARSVSRLPLEDVIFRARDRVFPALVHIEPILEVYSAGERARLAVTGSGVIFTAEGHVVTNNHVVERAERVTCTLSDKREVPAVVVGRDPETDVAVLRLDPLEAAGELPVAELGDSSRLQIGQHVMAMGSPLGLARSVSLGVISALDRYLPEDQMPTGAATGLFNTWIQTDAAINPGNSGGPLVDLDGRVIGINARAVTVFGENVGFAIPINLVREVAGQIIRFGSPRRSWLGANWQPLKVISDPAGGRLREGVLVGGVALGSPAERAGLRAGDVLVAYDGSPVSARYEEELPAFRKMEAETPVGRRVRLDVRRDGALMTFDAVTVERKTAEAEDFECREWGLTVREINEEIARSRNLDQTSGVIVTGSKRGSFAAEAELAGGVVIESIDGQTVPDLAAFRHLYQSLVERQSDRVLMVTRRGAVLHFHLLKPNYLPSSPRSYDDAEDEEMDIPAEGNGDEDGQDSPPDSGMRSAAQSRTRWPAAERTSAPGVPVVSHRPAPSSPAAIQAAGDAAPAAVSASPPSAYARLLRDAAPSVVAVQFQVRPKERPKGGEGPKARQILCGVVVGPPGQVLISGDFFPELDEGPGAVEPFDFRLVLQGGEEVPAEAVGVDRELNLGFLRADPALLGSTRPVRFDPSTEAHVGDEVVIVGLLSPQQGTDRVFYRALINGVLEQPRRRYTLDIPLQDLAIGGLVLLKDGRPLGIVGEDLLPEGPPEVHPPNVLSLFGSANQGPRPGYPVVLPYQAFARFLDSPPKLQEESLERRGWLGITMQPLTRDLAAYWGIQAPGGVIVTSVIEGSPASQAGLAPGDIILSVDGQEIPIREIADLPLMQRRIRSAGAGRAVPVAIWRGGTTRQVEVRLASSPVTVSTAEEFESERFGLKVRELTFDFLQAANLSSETRGVLVTALERAGWAQVSGLQPGDIIHKVDGQPTPDLESFRKALETAATEKRPEAMFFVLRDYQTQFVRVKTDWTER